MPSTANMLSNGPVYVGLCGLSGRIDEAKLGNVPLNRSGPHGAKTAELFRGSNMAVSLVGANQSQRIPLPHGFRGTPLAVLPLRGQVYAFAFSNLTADAGNLMFGNADSSTTDQGAHIAAAVDNTLALVVCHKEQSKTAHGRGTRLQPETVPNALPWLTFDPDELATRFGASPVHHFGAASNGGCAIVARLEPKQLSRLTRRTPKDGGECFFVLSGMVNVGGTICPAGTMGFLPPWKAVQMKSHGSNTAYVLSWFTGGVDLPTTGVQIARTVLASPVASTGPITL